MIAQPWKVNIFTLFPEMFPGPLGNGLSKKSLEQNIWTYRCINYRDYALDKHKTVDDVPYGGGAGMVIRPDIIGLAIEDHITPDMPIYYLSPRGEQFNMDLAQTLVSKKEINLVCGRYEGLDQRVIDYYQMQEISIGDYILSGGELAAQIVMDTCIRLLPNSIGNEKTHEEESFVNSLLEYSHYTRPKTWKNMQVPEVLLSGHHKNIKQWRHDESEKITKARRADLWDKYKKDQIGE